MSSDLVHHERRGAVHTLTMDSPHNRNALSTLLLDQLADGLHRATNDSAARAVIITATGSTFCSGADLSERRSEAGTPAPPTRLPEILTAIVTSRLPVIVRVNGHVRAGGIGLVAEADLSVAAAGCTLAYTEVRVGVAPAMILVPSLRVVASRFLSRMVLTGDPCTAADAAEAGLLSAVVDDEPSLDRWVAATVASLLKSAPGAVAATKALLRDLAAAPWDDGLTRAERISAELFAGPEAAEGMDAFLNKRAPSWVSEVR